MFLLFLATVVPPAAGVETTRYTAVWGYATVGQPDPDRWVVWVDPVPSELPGVRVWQRVDVPTGVPVDLNGNPLGTRELPAKLATMDVDRLNGRVTAVRFTTNPQPQGPP